MVSMISFPSGSTHMAMCANSSAVSSGSRNRVPPGRLEELARREEIADLEAQTRPGAFALAAAVYPERRARDEQFRHDLRLAHHFGIKDGLVKSHCPRHVVCPDEVFEFVDVHKRKC